MNIISVGALAGVCESNLNTKLHMKRFLLSPEQIFAALVVELSQWITNGRDQNVTAEAKTAKAIYLWLMELMDLL